MGNTTLRRLRTIASFAVLMASVLLCSFTAILWGPATALALGAHSGAEIPGAATPTDNYPSGAPFFNGQEIDIRIPANSIFQSGLKVNILECSDPGGSTGNLPSSINNCDGNTIQGNTVLINRDGSVDLNRYPVYALPNFPQLGESKTGQPVCNLSHACVLYIGENQESFTAPHYFSQPFYVASTEAQALANQHGGSGGSGTTLAIVLPIVAVCVLGAAVYFVRRRSATTPGSTSR